VGGYGSGRRQHKTSVEECLFLGINKLRRAGFSSAPVFAKSARALGKRLVARIRCDLIDERRSRPVVRIEYEIEHEGRRRKVVEPIPLQSTLLCSGGERWWFTCPLVIDGIPCDRRVGKRLAGSRCDLFRVSDIAMTSPIGAARRITGGIGWLNGFWIKGRGCHHDWSNGKWTSCGNRFDRSLPSGGFRVPYSLAV